MAEKNKIAKITIYGYDVAVVEEAAQLVGKKISHLKLTFSLIPLPVKKKTATVLISPHKHKRAQEKFKQKTHRRVFFVDNISPTDLEILEKLKIPETSYLEAKSSFN